MPTLLHLDASPRGDYSVSRQLSTAAVKAWKNKNPAGIVVERDLTKTALTFVDMEWIVGAFSAPDQHTDGNKRALAISDELVAEVLAADEIVIGTPMYNFAIPAALKAWIDHVVRAGKTFQYTATGVDGLATGKKWLSQVAAFMTKPPAWQRTTTRFPICATSSASLEFQMSRSYKRAARCPLHRARSPLRSSSLHS